MRLLVLLASACTIAEKENAPDFTCEGVPPPETAPARVTVTGVVRDITGENPLPGIMIQASVGGLPLEPSVSDANGGFTYSHETGGVPNNDVIESMFPGFITTLTYPGAPIAGDTFVEVRMVEIATAMEYAMENMVPLDLMAGAVLLRVTDCNESPVSGGTVTSDPPGQVFYFRFAAPDITATETDASGLALITNLPPGDVVLSGTIGEVRLRDNPVNTVPGAFVQTLARP